MPTDNGDRDWDLIEQLVFECLERDADGGDDAERRVAELLAPHDEPIVREVRRVLADLTGWTRPQPSDADLTAAGAGFGLRVPERLGPYRVGERVGQGGMGAVYVGLDESLDRRVALKIVRPELLAFGEARGRFRREIESVARLSHPGIVPVYQVGEDDGIPWFAMELVPGDSLAATLRRLHGRDPSGLRGDDLRAEIGADGASSHGDRLQGSWERICVRIAKELADALAHAHGRGVLHRDVKPSNVVLDATAHARLLDFGLARAEGGGDLTASGALLGSLPYLPPEHLHGRTAADDVRADVYALGVTLYEMLALRSPFVGETEAATMRNIEQGAPVALRQLHRGLSWEVATIVGVAIDREPARRYQSMADLAADLQRVLDRRPITARPPSPWRRLRRSCERNPIAATGIVAAVLASIALMLLYTFGLQDERDAAVAAQLESERLREIDRVRGYRAAVQAAHMAIQLGQADAARRQLAACPDELREFEWRHLAARLDQHLEAIPVSDKFLRGAVAIDNGLVTAGADGCVHRIAATEDRTITTFTPTDRPMIMAVDASADGRHVITGHMDHTVRLWDGERQALRAELPLDDLYGTRQIERLQQRCFAVTVAGDGRTAYAVGCGGAVAIYDLEAGRRTSGFLLPPVRGAVFSVAVSADGQLLAVGHGFDILLVRTTDGEIVHTLRGHSGYVHALQFAADGSQLVSASQDRTVRTWRVDTGEAGRVLFGHGGAVFDVAFGDEGTVWSASGDATLRQWSLQTGRERRRLLADTALYAVVLSRDRLVTAGWDGSLRIWDAARDRAHLHVDDQVATQLPKLIVHDDGARFSVLDVGTGVRTFSLPDGQPAQPLVAGTPEALATHNGRVAVAHGGSEVTFAGRTLTGAEDPVLWLCALPDGALAAAESSGHVVFWPAQRDIGVRVAAHTAPPWVLEPLGDGFVSAGEDGRVLRWRRDRPQELLHRDVEWHGAAASPDGDRLYLVGLGRLLAYDLGAGEVLWEREVAERMREVVVTGSGRRLLVVGADRFLHIVDAADGFEVLGLPTERPMRCIDYVADVAVTVSVYSSVDLWFGR